jgi:Lectin C-type domain
LLYFYQLIVCPYAAEFWPEASSYHAALHDHSDKGNFKWCKNGKDSVPLIKNGALQFDQKTQLANGENCGALQVLNDKQTLKLNVTACDESMAYLCEVNLRELCF